MNTTETTEQKFSTFMKEKGFSGEPFIFDGQLHRAQFGEKKNDNGYYVGHLDEPATVYAGDWATDQEWRYTPKNSDATPEEKAAIAKRFEEAKRRRAEEKRRVHDQAADEARRTWEAAKPAPDDHPYLKKKRVKPHGIRIQGKNLLIPVWNEKEEIRSLQTIAPNGKKLFRSGGEVKGNLFKIPGTSSPIAIGEGYATMATVHEATGWTCFCAFNAGNLEPVARKIRARYPNTEIIIVGDDDRWTK